MEHNKFSFLDFLVYFLIFLILTFLSISYLKTGIGRNANVFVSGKLIKVIPLNRNAEYTIKGQLGNFMIEVRSGKAGVLETSCPEKICKKMGFINRKGSEIICIPNRIMIKISGEAEVDDISR